MRLALVAGIIPAADVHADGALVAENMLRELAVDDRSGMNAISRRVITTEMAMPNPPPISDNSTLSVNSCRTS